MNKFSLIGVFLLALALVIPTISAADGYKIGDVETSQSACATDSALFILPITNTGSDTDSFTISLSGDAASFSVAAPAGFSLEPGDTEYVYIYSTPSSGALVSTYPLSVLVNSDNAGTKEVELEVKVLDCHSVELTAAKDSASTCACVPAEYTLSLKNTGKYTENFVISATGTAADWTTLSDENIKLASGENQTITATVKSACDATGNFGLTITAASKNSNALARQKLKFESLPCYDFELMPAKNYFSFCEKSEVKIPLTINNKGTAENTYTFSVDGPSWATAENTELIVPAGSSANTNLVLFPEYGISGEFDVTVGVESKLGEVSTQKEITANVLTCHSTSFEISKQEDTVCPFTKKIYEVNLGNTGQWTEHYAVSVSGADWASIDQNFVELEGGTAKMLNLAIEPKSVAPGRYTIKVKAMSQDSCATYDSDDIAITIADATNCFSVKTTAVLTAVEVAYGEGALVPIVVENKGTEESTYNLEISGTGASYAQLNPASITLGGGQAETVYLYVAVPEATPQAKYPITVSARLEDGTVSSSASVDVIVIAPEQKEEVTEETTNESSREQITEKLSGLKNPFSGLGAYFAGLGEKFSGTRDWISGAAAGAGASISAGLEGAKEFLFEQTYGVANWLWALTILIVLFIIAGVIVLKPKQKKGNKNNKNKKGLAQKFKDFLEEDEDEDKKKKEE